MGWYVISKETRGSNPSLILSDSYSYVKWNTFHYPTYRMMLLYAYGAAQLGVGGPDSNLLPDYCHAGAGCALILSISGHCHAIASRALISTISGHCCYCVRCVPLFLECCQVSVCQHSETIYKLNHQFSHFWQGLRWKMSHRQEKYPSEISCCECGFNIWWGTVMVCGHLYHHQCLWKVHHLGNPPTCTKCRLVFQELQLVTTFRAVREVVDLCEDPEPPGVDAGLGYPTFKRIYQYIPLLLFPNGYPTFNKFWDNRRPVAIMSYPNY
jgi:hypothetical protein